MHYNEKVYSIEEIKKIAGEIFDKACFVKEAYLFGSYAKGATGDSDLDFMAITNKPLGTYFYWLYDPLQDTLGKEVDVPTEDEHERLRYKERVCEDI